MKPEGAGWDLLLRVGLAWNDGTPVAAADCAPSLRRWRRREALKATSYRGQPIVILAVSRSISETACRLLARNMTHAGSTVDEQDMDWGTVLSRRARREGWHMFGASSNGTDMPSPLTHRYIASTCADHPGWSCDQATPPLPEAMRERAAGASPPQSSRPPMGRRPT